MSKAKPKPQAPALLPGLDSYQPEPRADWWKAFQSRDPVFAKQFVATVDAFLAGQLPQFPSANELMRWMLKNYRDQLRCSKSTLYKFIDRRREMHDA